MKICNLKIRIARRVAAFVIAVSGFLSTSLLYSFEEIALGDPSFEAFVVPAIGFAYSDEYRPTSAWVDDPDGATGGYYGEDDGNSNWLYSAAYGTGFRATPRTGDQAMHGIGYYNGQETVDAVFEANKTYTFSVWAQGDTDADDASSRVWLYIYDGSVPFTEAGSLEFARYAPDTGDFVNRDPLWTDAESMAGWTQISISHTVLPGAPEIGQPIGVAFWCAADGAVDDASLDVSAPGVVVGESLTVAPGIINSGGLPDLEESDNVSLVLFRDSTSTAAVTQFVLTSTSPTTTPTMFEFVLEGRCVSRPNVVQRVEFFNYVTGAFEVVDEQNAVRMPPDLSITVIPTGDLSRFVDSSTGEIQARVRYRADSPRASFSSRTDQAIWMIQ